jgi:hypothetical protein
VPMPPIISISNLTKTALKSMCKLEAYVDRLLKRPAAPEARAILAHLIDEH